MGPVTKGFKPMSHAGIQNFCVVGGGGVVQGRLLENSLILLMRKGILVCLVFLLTYLKG